MTDLSVVVPAYNEAGSVARFLTDLDADLAVAGFDRYEVVLVDDGSTDSTAELAAAATTTVPVRVISQPNAGRFGARRTGIDATSYDTVMLIDCGLALLSGSMTFLRDQLESHPERELWNGHVEIDTAHNPYAAFWSAIVRIFWGAYLRRPSLTSFGLDDFDRFPKGTTLFVAPAAALRAVVERFDLDAGAERFASDDTRMIRLLLERAPLIWIDPSFGCTYVARSTFGTFMSHCMFRGTTFVDGYWSSGGLLGRVVRTMAWVGPLTVLLLVVGLALAPLTVAVGLGCAVVIGVGAFFVAAVVARAPLRVAMQGAALLPAFVLAFGLGAARGLWLRLRPHGVRG
jgi:hypothetical protein